MWICLILVLRKVVSCSWWNDQHGHVSIYCQCQYWGACFLLYLGSASLLQVLCLRVDCLLLGVSGSRQMPCMLLLLRLHGYGSVSSGLLQAEFVYSYWMVSVAIWLYDMVVQTFCICAF